VAEKARLVPTVVRKGEKKWGDGAKKELRKDVHEGKRKKKKLQSPSRTGREPKRVIVRDIEGGKIQPSRRKGKSRNNWFNPGEGKVI